MIYLIGWPQKEKILPPAVVEVKGCGDDSKSLSRIKKAWIQTGRINLLSNNRKCVIKRMAIVSTWGIKHENPEITTIYVKGPCLNGSFLFGSKLNSSLTATIYRQHVSSLISPLGHYELANQIREIDFPNNNNTSQLETKSVAKNILKSTELIQPGNFPRISGLVGGIVTPADLFYVNALSNVDSEVVKHLNLNPKIVGIEAELIELIIDGKIEYIAERNQRFNYDDYQIGDPNGWVIPLSGNIFHEA